MFMLSLRVVLDKFDTLCSLTGCVYLFPLFFNLLFLKLQFMRIKMYNYYEKWLVF